MLVDAIHVKIRDGAVANRPIYIAVGINVAGDRDVLGMWVGTGGEGAKHWMACMAELRNRGVADVCILACDGLKGLPEAVAEIWPLATVQLCVVHLVRASLRYASKAHWGQLSKALRESTPHRPSRPPRPDSVMSRPSGAIGTRPSSGCGAKRGTSSPRS